jgi:hypothetical protein
MSHRTQITLTDDQYARLLDESSRTGLSLAALVRRAIESSYGAPDREDALLALARSFGSWQGRDCDGEEYVDRLRRGLGRRLEGK